MVPKFLGTNVYFYIDNEKNFDIKGNNFAIILVDIIIFHFLSKVFEQKVSSQ